MDLTKEIVGDLDSRVAVIGGVVAAKPACRGWEAQWKVKCEAKSRQHFNEVQWEGEGK